MSEPFDPYYVWLGIPPNEQPAHHYRLLGIAPMEPRDDVIRIAAQRQIAHVKTFAIGEHAELSQKLLNELSRARLTLLDPAKKAAYDAALRLRVAAPTQAAAPLPPPVAPRVQPIPSRGTAPEASAAAPVHVRARTERTWVIGCAPDCDIVVNRTTVSGYHCTLTRTKSGYVLEDLGSTNGTFVNGKRISARTPIARTDVIFLGRQVPFPWPVRQPEVAQEPPRERIIRIGAAPDNDLVIDLPMISSHHARITITARQTVIEDLGSTNGTALNAPDKKLRRALLRETDIVYFGSHAIPAGQLLARGERKP